MLYVLHQKYIHTVENYTVNKYKLTKPQVLRWDEC